jgi:iron only hydrogenase large subunit-like protein
MDGVREAEVTIPKSKCNAGEIKIKVAVVHEIRNVKKIMEDLDKGKCEYHFVEVMACPGGCLGGGGQPIPTNAEIRRKRMEGIYKRDKDMPIRKSHDNPAIKKLYEDYFQNPGGELSEKYLHTKYVDRCKK